MNGASFFFVVVYIHIFRGLYYGSYKEPRELLWMLGVVILLLMMATAFMGYVLPWGQMSYLGRHRHHQPVLGAIPVVGQTDRDLAVGRLRGRQPDAEPLLLAALPAAVHHRRRGGAACRGAAQHGSNNPLGIDRKGPQDIDPVPSLLHDQGHVRALRVPARSIAGFVFYAPNLLGDPANYIPANPLQTPPEIVPEWYFLPFYAILRSIPNKLSAACCGMFGSLARSLFLLPWLDTSRVRSALFRPVYKWVFWLLVIDVLRARLCRRAPARRLYIVHRPASRTLLLFLPLPRPVAAARLVRAAAAAADQHLRRGAGQARRRAAPAAGAAMEKHVMRKLVRTRRVSLALAAAGPGAGGGDAAAAQRELVVRRRLRHL